MHLHRSANQRAAAAVLAHSSPCFCYQHTCIDIDVIYCLLRKAQFPPQLTFCQLCIPCFFMMKERNKCNIISQQGANMQQARICHHSSTSVLRCYHCLLPTRQSDWEGGGAGQRWSVQLDICLIRHIHLLQSGLLTLQGTRNFRGETSEEKCSGFSEFRCNTMTGVSHLAHKKDTV